MSNDNPDDPENPFLRDEGLGSELDAWDSTFDALHAESEDPTSQASVDNESAAEGSSIADLATAPSTHSGPAPVTESVPSASADDFADIPTPEGGTAYPDVEPVVRLLTPPTVVAPATVKRTGPAIIRRKLPEGSGAANQHRAPLSDTKPLPMSDEPMRHVQSPQHAGGANSDQEPASRGHRATVPAPYARDNPADLGDPGIGLIRSSPGMAIPHDEASTSVEDDYADMEIGASVSTDEAGSPADLSAAGAVPARRTVAHVVRRSSVPTRAPERKSQTIETAPRVAEPTETTADEADFSDLAELPITREPEHAELADGADPNDDDDDDFITEPARPRRKVDSIIDIPDSDVIVLDDAADDFVTAIERSGSERKSRPTDGKARRRRARGQGRGGSARHGGTPAFDVAAIRFPEQVQPLSSAQFDAQISQMSLLCERELAVSDHPELNIEMGRLQEHLGDRDRARMHYDAALRSDPTARAALRGLRRLAYATGDISGAIERLDDEIAIAGGLERAALRDHRIELLLASGAYDQARDSVREALAAAPRSVRALLSAVELALVNGGTEEVSSTLERLADAVTDPGLRSALHSARGTVAAHDRDHGSAIAWFATAFQSDASAVVPRLAMAQHLAAQGNYEATAEMVVGLAGRMRSDDPLAAAALAIRALQWDTSAREGASAVAAGAMPDDPLVARVVAESAIATGDQAVAATALTAWARSSGSPEERAYAASRAAEFDPDGSADLWRIALEVDPGDDYVAAQLRTTLVAAAGIASAIDVDLQVAANGNGQRAQLRAGFGLMGEGKLYDALAILERSHRDHPSSLAVTEALAEGYAAAARWTERAQLLAELARRSDDPFDRDGTQLRSAVAWEEAVGAAAASDPSSIDELRRLTDSPGQAGAISTPSGVRSLIDSPGQAGARSTPSGVKSLIGSGLEAWSRMFVHADGRFPAAHAAAIVLATRLGDPNTLDEVLARAQAAETSPWAASSLALRRARPLMRDRGTVSEAEAIVRDALASGPNRSDQRSDQRPDKRLDHRLPGGDPRRTLWLMVGAARRDELADAATALQDRAEAVGATPEAASLRLRAAQIAVEAGDAARAVTLLTDVQKVLPTLPALAELLALARRKAGDSVPVPPTQAAAARSAGTERTDEPGEAFAHLIRDAEAAFEQGDSATATTLLQRAIEQRPGDALALSPLRRVARHSSDVASLTAVAMARLHAAEAAGNAVAVADAHGQLALIDLELRNDASSAQGRLRSAMQADPTRLDLLHRLYGELSRTDPLGTLLPLRRAELDQLPLDLAKDRAAILMDIAGLADRDRRSDAELAPLYRDVLAADPRHRQALFLLESLVRRAGSSPDLAQLEEQVARYFEGDIRAQAAFYTRAGETLAELEQIDAAVQKFGMADEVSPGHVPALTGWRDTAMRGQLWIDVAQAVTRLAAAASDASQRARLHHFAGVALMDKALVGEQAVIPFRKALQADPRHKDAFVRLRIVLEEEANHDELAAVLDSRLQVETEPAAKLEIHRALAELHRNFLDSRDTAKSHYREILAIEPNDLRAHAAIADIAWEQGNWQEAADALIVRAKLERDAATLSTLCYRLGLLYADRLSDPAMALRAFQRALTYQPNDVNTLVRLVDLASVAGEWKLALGACERLVTIEQDPEPRVAHLHRVAKVFRLGFGDAKRAERALNLALEGAPTNDDALAQVVQFYREAGDMTSVRVHVNRVIGAMRSRVANSPSDGVPYRVIARAMAAREGAGVVGSLPVARVAAELAVLLGAAAEPERQLVAEPATVDVKRIVGAEADEALFPRAIQPELRQMFRALDDRLAKLVGVDLDVYGVNRVDRFDASGWPVAQQAREVATAFGVHDLDVYVSTRMPFAMVVEPTSPLSLVIGQRIADEGNAAIRFAAGAALKLAHVGLAIPARLSPSDLGGLVVALMRCFQSEFPSDGLDDEAIAAHVQKLRRLLSASLMAELRPLALAIDGARFNHRQLAADLQVAGLRAGFIASGSITASLGILAARRDMEVLRYLSDPEAQQLIDFAISEDYAGVAR